MKKVNGILSDQNPTNILGRMIYNHNNEGCPDLKDSVYLILPSSKTFDSLPMFVI